MAMAFKDDIAAWVPASELQGEGYQRWEINPDGSVTITLPSVIAANLAADLVDWERISGWVDRPDCQNWRRSPIARENRRESIVYGNALETIKCLLGRREVRALMERIKELDAEDAKQDEG